MTESYKSDRAIKTEGMIEDAREEILKTAFRMFEIYLNEKDSEYGGYIFNLPPRERIVASKTLFDVKSSSLNVNYKLLDDMMNHSNVRKNSVRRIKTAKCAISASGYLIHLAFAICGYDIDVIRKVILGGDDDQNQGNDDQERTHEDN
jgi:hypothetical protein